MTVKEEDVFAMLLKSCPKPSKSPDLLNLKKKGGGAGPKPPTANSWYLRNHAYEPKTSILKTIVERCGGIVNSQSYVTPLQIACCLYDWKAVEVFLARRRRPQWRRNRELWSMGERNNSERVQPPSRPEATQYCHSKTGSQMEAARYK